MPTPGDQPPPVTERKPSETAEPQTTDLDQRIRQQRLLAELGVSALRGTPLDELLSDTVRLVAEGLGVDLCKVLEHQPAEQRLIVRAGIGWEPGVVGKATIGADLASPSGFALRTGRPVISNHLEIEDRFRTPELLVQHGVRRAMNVILQGNGRPFGVLEVDSRSDQEFVEHDLAFLQGAANILGMAIERQRHEERLRQAIERQRFLLKEMNHRVKNSLAIVSSLLNLQMRDVGDETLSRHLGEAARRVAAVAKAHDQLSRSSRVESMDIGLFIEAIARDLDDGIAQCDVRAEAEKGIDLPPDRAISIALMVNELMTNAAKYAYAGRPGGPIWITVSRLGHDRFTVGVRDEGTGLPRDFDPARNPGLGMRIVATFARQLGAVLDVRRLDPGTEFLITLPLAGA